MTRIIGIDPGSIKTGYGIIDVDGNHNVYIDSGCIRIKGESLPDKLKVIFTSIDELLKSFQPDVMAIEQVFMQRNADSALKLGQARGAAICVGVMHTLPVFEYTPRGVKQSVVGKGSASKDQVQHMVKILLALSESPQEDAADALAIALCHAHTNQGLSNMPGVTGKRGGRLR